MNRKCISRRGFAAWGMGGVAALGMGRASAHHGQAGAHGPQLAQAMPPIAPTPAGPPAGLGDLSRQAPVEVVVELGGAEGTHRFVPSRLRFRTGRLYKLVLRNHSAAPHYFTSDGMAASVWTRKVQVMAAASEGGRVLAEIKGAVREIEVHPGGTTEWWFVPVQAGRFTDLRCEIKAEDGRSHAEHGMRGEVVID